MDEVTLSLVNLAIAHLAGLVVTVGAAFIASPRRYRYQNSTVYPDDYIMFVMQLFGARYVEVGYKPQGNRRTVYVAKIRKKKDGSFWCLGVAGDRLTLHLDGSIEGYTFFNYWVPHYPLGRMTSHPLFEEHTIREVLGVTESE